MPDPQVDRNELLLLASAPVISAVLNNWGNLWELALEGVDAKELDALNNRLYALDKLAILAQKRTNKDIRVLHTILCINNLLDLDSAITACISPQKHKVVKTVLEKHFKNAWTIEAENYKKRFEDFPEQHRKVIDKISENEVNLVLKSLKDAIVYGGLRQRIEEEAPEIIQKIKDSKKSEAAQNADDYFSEIFIKNLSHCHLPTDYATYIIKAAAELNRKDAAGQRIYKEDVASILIGNLTDIYHAINTEAENYKKDAEVTGVSIVTGFNKDEKNLVRTVINQFYNIRLIEELKNENDISFIMLDEEFRQKTLLANARELEGAARAKNYPEYKRLLTTIIADPAVGDSTKTAINLHIANIEKLVTLNDQLHQSFNQLQQSITDLKNENDTSFIMLDAEFRNNTRIEQYSASDIEELARDLRDLEGAARAKNYEEYIRLLRVIIAKPLPGDDNTKINTKIAINAHIANVQRLMVFNNQLHAAYPAALSNAGPMPAVGVVVPPVAAIPAQPVGSAAVAVAPAPVPAVEHIAAAVAPQPPQPTLVTQYNHYIQAIYQSDPNPIIQGGLDAQKRINNQWIFGKYQYALLPENPVINASLANFKQRIIVELNNYLEERESSFWLKLRYAVRGREGRERDLETTRARRNLVETIIRKLEQKNTPQDFVGFVNDLTADIQGIEGPSTKLKPLLITIQSVTSKYLSKIDINLQTAEQDVRRKRKPYQIVNKRFNDTIVASLNDYKNTRNSTTDGAGFMGIGILKSIWNNGLFNTLNERVLKKVNLKTTHNNYADYFASQIIKCETSDDYTTFVVEAAYMMNELKREGRNNADLDKHLESYQRRILRLFMFSDRQPQFTLQQKISMCAALEYYGGVNNPLAQQIKEHIKKHPVEGKIYSDEGYREQFSWFSKNISYEAGIIVHKMRIANITNAELNTTEKAEQFRFYLRDHLLRQFLANKALGSGKIQGKSGPIEGAAGNLSTVANLAGLGAVPGGTQALSLATKIAVDYEKQCMENEVNNVAAAFESLPQIQQLVDNVATVLADRYLWQIGKVDKSEVTMLGGCAMERIMNYISSGKLNTAKQAERNKANTQSGYVMLSDTDLLVLAVSNNELWHGSIPFTSRSIAVENDDAAGWTVEELFAKPAIMDITGDNPIYYVKSDEPYPPKYGFIVGTSAEAIRYGYNRVVDQPPGDVHPALAKKREHHQIANAPKVHQEEPSYQSALLSAEARRLKAQAESSKHNSQEVLALKQQLESEKQIAAEKAVEKDKEAAEKEKALQALLRQMEQKLAEIEKQQATALEAQHVTAPVLHEELRQNRLALADKESLLNKLQAKIDEKDKLTVSLQELNLNLLRELSRQREVDKSAEAARSQKEPARSQQVEDLERRSLELIRQAEELLAGKRIDNATIDQLRAEVRLLQEKNLQLTHKLDQTRNIVVDPTAPRV